MPVLIANWKPLALLLYTVAVWHAHTIYDRAKDADRITASQEATKTEMSVSYDIDAGFNAFVATLNDLQTNVNRSLDHETPLPDCRISAGRVSALRQAIAGNPAAR